MKKNPNDRTQQNSGKTSLQRRRASLCVLTFTAVGTVAVACSGSNSPRDGRDASAPDATRDGRDASAPDARGETTDSGPQFTCTAGDTAPLRQACTAFCNQFFSSNCLHGERWGPGYFSLYLQGPSARVTVDDCVASCAWNGAGEKAKCVSQTAAFVACMGRDFPTQTCVAGASYLRWAACDAEYAQVNACDLACIAPGCQPAGCNGTQIVCGDTCISCSYACDRNRCTQTCSD